MKNAKKLGWMFTRPRSQPRFSIAPGKLLTESILETKAATILRFPTSCVEVAVTFEEGTNTARVNGS